jgi:hypothetical protein
LLDTLAGVRMVYVSAFTVQGLQLIFHSLDHAPPHFHVRSSRDWEIRVFIDTSTKESGLDYNYKFPKNISKKFRGLSKDNESELLEKVIKHKVQLLHEWEEKVSSGEML